MKIVKRLAIGLIIVIVALVLFILVAGDKSYDAPYPDITATDDPEVIDRGEYLVYGPAACAYCHVPMDQVHELEAGEQVPLIGGFAEDIPPARLRAPNITPDPETGIGNLSDKEIARALRYNVGHDGRLILPVMDFQAMSDEDLTAIISYLRAQEPVHNEVEPTEFTFLGKALIAFGALNPHDHSVTPLSDVEKEPSAEYGGYLAIGVAHCMGCHTEFNPVTGDFVGEPYSGGFNFGPNPLSDGHSFVSPNLTPDPETGVMAEWSKETFINRFKAGRVHPFFSPMPWGAYSRMDSTDLAAIYNFLQTLEPVHNEIEQTVIPPE